MAGHFCINCIFFQQKIFTRSSSAFGICTNDHVTNLVAMDKPEKPFLEEDQVFYTGEYFGCVYWRKKLDILFDLIPETATK